jgi:hypothetical protein
MSSLKRSASLYVNPKLFRSSSKQHQPVIANKENEVNPSRMLRNKFKSYDDHSLLASSQKQLNLSISDCTCPICLEVLVEPVKMPCTHELCLPCFKAMTDQTNFLCPMCRMRISTWSRNASNSNTLVNQDRWEEIKRAFPVEIQNRLEGKTAILLAQSIKMQAEAKAQEATAQSTNSNKKQCSKPGEIRKEYQDYLKREEEKLKMEKENEEKLSLELIQQLIVSWILFFYVNLHQNLN